jgi:hypothetical protein
MQLNKYQICTSLSHFSYHILITHHHLTRLLLENNYNLLDLKFVFFFFVKFASASSAKAAAAAYLAL